MGTHVGLDNVTVTRVDPTKIKYGFCWDDLEWFETQEIPTQIRQDFVRHARSAPWIPPPCRPAHYIYI